MSRVKSTQCINKDRIEDYMLKSDTVKKRCYKYHFEIVSGKRGSKRRRLNFDNTVALGADHEKSIRILRRGCKRRFMTMAKVKDVCGSEAVFGALSSQVTTLVIKREAKRNSLNRILIFKYCERAFTLSSP